MLKYANTPLFEWTGPDVNYPISICIKREDQNHPTVSGNKWWKLKYNLAEARRVGKSRLLTFGGAYSNHVYATAAAAAEEGLGSVGIIRGEETLPLNPTLAFARERGMELHYVSRLDYRNKTGTEFLAELGRKFPDCYFIPEGGTNSFAIKGCEEFAAQLLEEIAFDYLCLAVGTGGTMAGMISGFGGEKEVVGFPVLKDGQFLEEEIRKWLPENSNTNWRLVCDYHFGGYAKSTHQLEDFITAMKQNYALPLDRVYTSKLCFGVLDLARKKYFRPNSRVLILHSGGLHSAK